MGNHYEELMCGNCGELTVHRIVRRYGKSEKGKRGKGSKSLRREVVKCLSCQKKQIKGRIHGKRTHTASFR